MGKILVLAVALLPAVACSAPKSQSLAGSASAQASAGTAKPAPPAVSLSGVAYGAGKAR